MPAELIARTTKYERIVLVRPLATKLRADAASGVALIGVFDSPPAVVPR